VEPYWLGLGATCSSGPVSPVSGVEGGRLGCWLVAAAGLVVDVMIVAQNAAARVARHWDVLGRLVSRLERHAVGHGRAQDLNAWSGWVVGGPYSNGERNYCSAHSHCVEEQGVRRDVDQVDLEVAWGLFPAADRLSVLHAAAYRFVLVTVSRRQGSHFEDRDSDVKSLRDDLD